jgi:hypothetical protein
LTYVRVSEQKANQPEWAEACARERMSVGRKI